MCFKLRHTKQNSEPQNSGFTEWMKIVVNLEGISLRERLLQKTAVKKRQIHFTT